MAAVAVLVRGVSCVLIVVAGVLGVSSLLGGPSAGDWRSALTGAAVVVWLIVFDAFDRQGDRTDRWLFWVGLAGGGTLLVLGVIDALT